MAALTWREVSAPNFSGANDSLRTANAGFDRAFQGLSDMLGNLQAQRTAGADSQVLANALRINDPAAYREALSQGTLLNGVDPRTVSPQAIASLGSRAADLLNQAGGQQRLNAAQYAQDRTISQDQIQDAARASVASSLGINNPTLAAMSPEQQQEFARNQVALTGGNLNNQNRAFQNTVQARDDSVNQQAIAGADEIRRVSASADDARGQLDNLDGLNPVVRSRMTALLGQDFGPIYAPVGSGAPAGSRVSAPAGSQGAGTANGSAYDATFNFTATDRPVTSMKIGDVLSMQDGLRASQGHSPVGAFQINQATLEDYGPKVLGENWRDRELTPEVQERIAKQLFDDRKGRDLTKTWSSLPNSSPGAYKDYTWEEMRHILSMGETGQSLPDSPGQLSELAGRSAFEVNRRVSQNNTVGTVADTQANLGNTSDPLQIANELIKTRFTGADVDALLSQITRGMAANPGLSAADVGSAIARSASPASSIPFTSNFLGTTNFGNGLGVNDERLANMLRDMRAGSTDYMAQANADTAGRAQAIQIAEQNLQQAVQELGALRSRQTTQRGISTDRAEARVERLTEILQRALAGQQSDPNLRPVRQ